ncbi:hypothetical protein AB4571_02015 [Vibrio breoganii]|nr:hypothetical protein [Vibrio breoganii]
MSQTLIELTECILAGAAISFLAIALPISLVLMARRSSPQNHDRLN